VPRNIQDVGEVLQILNAEIQSNATKCCQKNMYIDSIRWE